MSDLAPLQLAVCVDLDAALAPPNPNLKEDPAAQLDGRVQDVLAYCVDTSVNVGIGDGPESTPCFSGSDEEDIVVQTDNEGNRS